MTQNIWTQKEDEIINNMFSTERIWDVLDKIPDKTPREIIHRAEKLNVPRNDYPKNRYKYAVNENFFKEWTPQSSWLYGFIVADGHITTGRRDRDERQLQFELAEYDEDILIQIKNLLQYEGEIKRSKRNTVKLQISNKIIVDDLIYLGIPLFDKTKKPEVA